MAKSVNKIFVTKLWSLKDFLSRNEWKQNQFWKVETISLCWVTNLCVISVTVTVDTISSSKSELPIASYIIYYIMIHVLPSGIKWVHRILLRWMLGYGNIKVNSKDWCLFKVRVQHRTKHTTVCTLHKIDVQKITLVKACRHWYRTWIW